jgi:predicted nucleic acid-binding protein
VSFVVDASVALAFCFADEAPKGADALLDELAAASIEAPSHWPLEVANALWASSRRGRITPQQEQEFIALLQGLGVALDPETATRAFSDTRALSDRYALTVYDAAYLELAMRRGATLVSKDKALLKAAGAAGVKTKAI